MLITYLDLQTGRKVKEIIKNANALTEGNGHCIGCFRYLVIDVEAAEDEIIDAAEIIQASNREYIKCNKA